MDSEEKRKDFLKKDCKYLYYVTLQQTGVTDIHLPFLCFDKDAKDSVEQFLLRPGENVIKIARCWALELNRQLLFFCH